MGYLYNRSGHWAYRIATGKNSQGKRTTKTQSGFPTKKAAQMAMIEAELQIKRGTYFHYRITIEELALSWLDRMKLSVRTNTLNKYTYIIHKRLIPAWGKKRLMDVTAKDVETYYRALITDEYAPLAPRTVQDIHKVFKALFNEAKKYGYLTASPLDLVRAPSSPRKKLRYWNEEQSKMFLERAEEEREYIIYVLALGTGMRQAEILGLHWEDVDFKRKSISVRQTLSRNGKVFEEVKSTAGYRGINISTSVMKALHNWKAYQENEKNLGGEEYQENDLVVTTTVGTPFHSSNVSRSWRRLLEKVDVPRIRFHDMRHTHATLLLKQGIHPKIVSERLGHANVRVTLDTYSHVLPGLQEVAADAIEEVLF
ncbi:site-specific integrase [Priestia megaterium]|nr:site-specific integrase [Priestia megaterium]